MPEVRNCRRCGKIFNYIGSAPICPICRSQDEEEYKKVKEYLYEYPGATMSQLSSDLGISVEKIRIYLKEGRIEIIGDDPNFILACETCGKSIKTGRYCSDCTNGLARELQSTAGSMKRPSPPKNDSSEKSSKGLRYLHKDDKK